MITLKKLQWDNCFSYGSNNSIDLNDSTLTQLVGTNGAGKSSIPLVIEEVLFNKNSKGIKKADIQNRAYNKGYNIFLDFSVETKPYRVEVRRSRGSIKVKLFSNKEDVSSHTATNTYKTLEGILGLDFKTFSQLVYQSTSASLQFLTATDANRKKFLVDLFGINEYTKYYEVFRDISKKIAAEINEFTGTSNTIVKWLHDNKLSNTKLLSKLNLPENSDEDEKALRLLTVDFENIRQRNQKIRVNNTYKELLANISSTDFTLVGAEQEGTQSYDDIMADIGANTRILKDSAKEIAHLENLKEECPTCHQKINPGLTQSLKKQNLARSQKAEASNVHNVVVVERIKRINSTISTKIKKQKEFEDIVTRVDHGLPERILDGEELSVKIENLKTSIAKTKTQLREVINENTQREQYNTRVQVILEQTRNFEEELERVKKGLSKQEKIFNNLEVLKKSFSTNGLIAYKLENLVKELEDLANEYLAELSDGRKHSHISSNTKVNE